MNNKLTTELNKCRLSLFSKLKKLRDHKILEVCFSTTDVGTDENLLYEKNANNFEILEFYGDAVLYEKITKLLFMTNSFCSPCLLTSMRQDSVSNKTLSIVYDSLEIHKLAHTKLNLTTLLEFKVKADIVEALIGELSNTLEKKSDGDYLAKLCQETLNDLISYIFHTGQTLHYSKTETLKDVKEPILFKDKEVKEHQTNCFICGIKGHYQKQCPKKDEIKKIGFKEEKEQKKVTYVIPESVKTPPFKENVEKKIQKESPLKIKQKPNLLITEDENKMLIFTPTLTNSTIVSSFDSLLFRKKVISLLSVDKINK